MVVVVVWLIWRPPFSLIEGLFEGAHAVIMTQLSILNACFPNNKLKVGLISLVSLLTGLLRPPHTHTPPHLSAATTPLLHLDSIKSLAPAHLAGGGGQRSGRSRCARDRQHGSRAGVPCGWAGYGLLRFPAASKNEVRPCGSTFDRQVLGAAAGFFGSPVP